jgi:catechol 2,3-dioxygenase-like lactoylglutathione lyase family enzyme
MTPAHITLGVSDLDLSARFYGEALGLDVRRSGHKLTISFGDFAVLLEEAHPAERAKLSLGFRVPSAALLGAIAERAKGAGGQILGGPAEREDGGQALLLMDPDSYMLEIIAP